MSRNSIFAFLVILVLCGYLLCNNYNFDSRSEDLMTERKKFMVWFERLFYFDQNQFQSCKYSNCEPILVNSLNVKELYEEKKGTMDGMVVFGKICNVKEELDAFLKYGTKLLKPGAPLILYLRDMPYWKGFKCFNSVNFHYAMTYRSDADIYFPYGMVLPKNQTSPLLSSFSWPWKKPHSLVLGSWKSFNAKAAVPKVSLNNRPKDILWFVSHCEVPSGRAQFATQLRSALNGRLNVEILGECGKSGSRASHSRWFTTDMEVYSGYKFYLSLENNICPDYITEKFFKVLSHTIPIILGASKDAYSQVAPPHSYIHMNDFPDMKALANYLVEVAKSPSLYNEYFWWTKYYTPYVLHFTEQYNVNIPPEFNPNCKLCELFQTYMGKQPNKRLRNLETYWIYGDCANPFSFN